MVYIISDNVQGVQELYVTVYTGVKKMCRKIDLNFEFQYPIQILI